jgi:hypothetical protein
MNVLHSSGQRGVSTMPNPKKGKKPKKAKAKKGKKSGKKGNAWRSYVGSDVPF